MATSAFRSTTRRSSIVGAASSSNTDKLAATATHQRRSRSLSRHSGRFPPPDPVSDAAGNDLTTNSKGRLVNKSRGSSAFLEISLDDLADEFFRARAESDEESEAASVATARSGGGGRGAGARYRMETESSRQRGRSVSRPPGGRSTVQGKGGSGGDDGGDLRRRRSLSVAQRQRSDLENDVASRSNQIKSKFSGNTKLQQSSSQKPAKTSHGLRRSMSDKDFLLSHDSNSSHSSLTDDEACDFHPSKRVAEKAIYALEKAEIPIGDDEGIGLYEAMRKEVRDAVEDIQTELEKVTVKSEPAAIIAGDDIAPKSSEALQDIVKIRRNYNMKLEQSQKRKQDLMSLLAAEEERGQELSKIVMELLPSPEKPAFAERQTRSRKRSNDRMKISKRLTEEAERYLVDFLSNVEDTDISSFDGERSDTGSSLRERMQHHTNAEKHESALKSAPLPADADDVMHPWLQWEAHSDRSPHCKPKARSCMVSGNISSFASQEDTADSNNHDLEGSWRSRKPEGNGMFCVSRGFKESKLSAGWQLKYSSIGKSRVCSFNMEEYSCLEQSEDFLFERFRQRKIIDSGNMVLCERVWI